MLPYFEALEARMNENVDADDVVDKVDQVQTKDIEESLEDIMKRDNVETEFVEKNQ